MENKRFKCDVCEKRFVNSTMLLRHQVIHTGEKSFRCDVCEKAFSQSSHLQSHHRIHTGEKPFTCELCDKSFTQSSSLIEHKRLHAGEKPFRCDVCEKTFNRKANLQSHQRVHTGEKPYTCEVCNESFSDSSTLRRHQRIHTRVKRFTYEVFDNSFSQLSHLNGHQRVDTGEQLFPCQLAQDAQECSSTGGRFPYSKELTELEGFMSKLFDLSNPTITNDTRVSMDTSDGDGGELAAATEIPERADEEGTEVNTSQQCGMAVAVEEGEEYQEGKMSDLEGSVDEFKLNIVTCVKEEACDDLAAVVEQEHSEPSADEEPAAFGAGAPSSPRAHGQHQAHAAGEENENDPKALESLHQEQVQSTESYQATSDLLEQSLTEFKIYVNHNLQRNNEILQHHLQRNNEILLEHLQRNNEIFQNHRQRNNEILQQHLQRKNEILQQQNEVLCQLRQRSNGTLNKMRPSLPQITEPAPSDHQQPSAETSAAGHPPGTGEVTSGTGKAVGSIPPTLPPRCHYLPLLAGNILSGFLP
ncbi:zinc finger protein 107-like isoform X2 [Scyliorhinus canicula]|uniref:zinc finger protein 107-like isoform X2 n=1 Tax=Scyliorhinus canicula TaxID=7830 RepID=UPI0018F71EDC|nr:zinc finger protein 107-like isoform X2 [Scyliorhinus canicula]